MKRGPPQRTADDMGNAIAAAAANEPGAAPPLRSAKKSKKMVNKLLRSTTTPAGILSAFRRVYGPDVRAELQLAGDGFVGTKPASAVADLILWALEGPSKRNTPAWVSISNRPLVQHVTVVTVPGLDPQWLTTRSGDLAFLSSLQRKTLRVTRTGRYSGMTERVLICKPAAKTTNSGASSKRSKKHKKKRSKQSHEAGTGGEVFLSVDPGKTPSHPFVLQARARPLPREEMERNVVDGASLFRDSSWLGDVPTSEFIQATSERAQLEFAAIDCEMCTTDAGSELTRISVVNILGETVYDALVKPDNRIIDYCTPYSGITRSMLVGVKRRLVDVHADLFGTRVSALAGAVVNAGTGYANRAEKSRLPLIGKSTVLVGHSIENDLKALQLLHGRVLDTALLYPHPRGPPYRSALRFLSKKWLGRQIQAATSKDEGHDSVEDALAALDLTLMKLHCGPTFGTPANSALNGESVFSWLQREGMRGKAVTDEDFQTKGDLGACARVEAETPAKGTASGASTTTCLRYAVMGDAMAIRGHTEGGADAIVVAGGDAAIGKRLIRVSGKYRLICGMLSDLDDFDLRSNSTSPGGEGHGESLSCRDKAKANKHHQDELQHLVQSTDEILRQVYDSLPENGLFIISLQGGVHAKREGGSSEICAADNAAALLAIKV